MLAGQRSPLGGGPPCAQEDELNSTLAQLLMVMERLDERIGMSLGRPSCTAGKRAPWSRKQAGICSHFAMPQVFYKCMASCLQRNCMPHRELS